MLEGLTQPERLKGQHLPSKKVEKAITSTRSGRVVKPKIHEGFAEGPSYEENASTHTSADLTNTPGKGASKYCDTKE